MKKIIAACAFLGCCYAPILNAQPIEDPATVTPIQPPEKPGVTSPTPTAPASGSTIQIEDLRKLGAENLSQEQRDKLLDLMQEKWKAMTSEERQLFRIMLREKLKQMPEEERIKLLEGLKRDWQGITPEQKKDIQQRAQEYWQSLPIQERVWILQQQQKQ